MPDGKLIRDVRYPGQSLSEEDAIARYKEELLEQSNGVTSFIPVSFQLPVIIAVAYVGEDFRLRRMVSLDEPEFRPREMAQQFWSDLEGEYDHASIVTFNGRGFDVPLLELMAFRYGIKAQRHFRDKFAGRFRFGTKHIDLHDWVTNFSATRMAGGLNLFSKVLGAPGKMGTAGDDVHAIYNEGDILRINRYCIHDVLDTYRVFLRTRVMIGELSLEDEQTVVEDARNFLEMKRDKEPAFDEYLENWKGWDPWP